MNAATWPRDERGAERLLCIDPAVGVYFESHIRELARVLEPGDLLVVNDASTVPASLALETESGERVELRLAAHVGGTQWWAVLFGRGDWRTPTEDRAPPPPVDRGAVLRSQGGIAVRIRALSSLSERLVLVDFDGDEAGAFRQIYAEGRPVQYSYLRDELAVGQVQTAFARRPCAVEMPSAGRPLTWSLLFELRARGVRIERLTHAAGLSATGDEALDAVLPLPERYDIPYATVRAIEATREHDGRVVAVGTTVVRALEGCVWQWGTLVPGPGTTDLILTADAEPTIVDGILTGSHDPGESHFRLLAAFAPPELLLAAHRHAVATGYLSHEFGDTALVLGGVALGSYVAEDPAREPRAHFPSPATASSRKIQL